MTMKPETVAVTPSNAQPIRGSQHDLWISERYVLTISIDKQCNYFPPIAEQCGQLNEMIQGLARAAKAVTYHAENDEKADSAFSMQPIDNVMDAIILLSQLSQAIRSEAQA